MRISDWSSDVCSSDLPTANKPGDSLFCSGHSFLSDGRLLVVGGGGDGTGARHNHGWIFNPDPSAEAWNRTVGNGRSEERRVGKEWGRKVRSRWCTEH